MRRWLTPLIVTSAAVTLFIVERRRPLRNPASGGMPPHSRSRNLAMGALTIAMTAPVQSLLVRRALRESTERRAGLLQRTRLPFPMRLVLGVLLLDYSLWWWHRLNHVWAPLWRFHSVHHADPELDTSTSVRFHAGEMIPAAVFRAAQIRILGIDRAALVFWQRLLLVSILFHHSNVRLPEQIERRLARFVVTPRMHGIHHSDVEEETRSNWSSLFSVWDFVHGTFLWDVPQAAITIGLPRRRRRAPPAQDRPPRPSGG